MFRSVTLQPPQDRIDGEPIVIGLVNNMPDGALRTTEQQFREVLRAAAGEIPVCLKVFFLPEVPRSSFGSTYVREHYGDISDLESCSIDGLIVTGMPPSTPDMNDEPYWSTLTELVDWADSSTTSTIWSCLAAHAAVLHADRIARQPLSQKISGVFECAGVADHPFLFDVPPRWSVPHSRYNGLSEEALVSRGYQVLSKSPEVGVDMFVKRRNSLFVFMQGHPEYDPAALLREYRRDIDKFLEGRTDIYPEIPRGYFDESSMIGLAAFRDRAIRDRSIKANGELPRIVLSKRNWRTTAVSIYANWLACLTQLKDRKAKQNELPDTAACAVSK